jgi:hypothetical protein
MLGRKLGWCSVGNWDECLRDAAATPKIPADAGLAVKAEAAFDFDKAYSLARRRYLDRGIIAWASVPTQ